MLRPMATMPNTNRLTASRVAALAGAGVIEFLLIAAMLGGLGARIVSEIPRALSMVDIIQPAPPPKPAPVPVPKPELVQPSLPTVALPDIRIERSAPKHAITVLAAGKPVLSTAAIATKPALTAAIPETPLTSVIATHTTPPYPDISLRLSESGSVQLHIVVDDNGGISHVSVTQSSGHARLDQAALEWVKNRWRYHAATRNGAAVASETDALVVFDLRRARR
jgi:protein TonB